MGFDFCHRRLPSPCITLLYCNASDVVKPESIGTSAAIVNGTTPKAIVAQIAQATHTALADRDFQQMLIEGGLEPDLDSTREVPTHPRRRCCSLEPGHQCDRIEDRLNGVTNSNMFHRKSHQPHVGIGQRARISNAQRSRYALMPALSNSARRGFFMGAVALSAASLAKRRAHRLAVFPCEARA
jgi:hypothetical protein